MPRLHFDVRIWGRVAIWAVGALVGIACLAGVAWVIWKLPPKFYSYVPDAKDRANAEASTRTGMIAGVAGLVALGGLAVTARTYRLSQQGQVTDRYTKAIAQLGDENLDVRLGGIFALERLANDSRRDHPTVVEVLSAFVRERANPARPEKPTVAEVLQVIFGGSNSIGTATIDAPSPKNVPTVREMQDVYSALRVLGRLPVRAGVKRAELPLARLAVANFEEANLTAAVFIRSTLTRSYFKNAKLKQASFFRADLTGANFESADIRNATFQGATLLGVNFVAADLMGATLSLAYWNSETTWPTDLLPRIQAASDMAEAGPDTPPGAEFRIKDGFRLTRSPT
jgi:hypothetical protein